MATFSPLLIYKKAPVQPFPGNGKLDILGFSWIEIGYIRGFYFQYSYSVTRFVITSIIKNQTSFVKNFFYKREPPA